MRKEVVITGKVVHGDGYGQKLGFPTANLDRKGYSRLKRKPKLGIYAGTATILPPSLEGGTQGGCYRAAIVIGPRDDKGHPKIEAYLLDFAGVLYEKRLTLTLQHYLRPFVSFRNAAALKEQIRKDLRAVRELSPLTKGATLTSSRSGGCYLPTQKTASRRVSQPQVRRVQ